MDKRPWYREPYVWLILLFPALAVVGGIITLNIAILFKDSLVVDDYYKQGIEINRVLERDQAASRHGLQATLHLKEPLIWLSLTSRTHYKAPPQITLKFIHHTRAGFDNSLMLEKIGEELYRGQLPQLVPGKWDLELAAEDWRLTKTFQVPLVNKEISIVPVYGLN